MIAINIKIEIEGLRKKLIMSSSSLNKIIRTSRLQKELKQTLAKIEKNINETISKLEEFSEEK